jgi:hypothetical protein
MREDAATKARRLLTEGRVSIEIAAVSEPFLGATVRGDSGEFYACGYELDAGGWWCSCPARGRCAHLQALMLIFAINSVRTYNKETRHD